MNRETSAALLIIQRQIERDADLAEGVSCLACIGHFMLARLGFPGLFGPGVEIDIGDAEPGKARITLTWPLDERPEGEPDE